jgi:beta-glucanase (GH16 family)
MFVFVHKFQTNIIANLKVIRLLFLILLFGLQLNNAIAQDYQLVWADEFDGTALDLSKWECQIGNGSGGWGNNEKEYYRAENAVVKDGYLTITAKKESYNNFNYTSARIRTKDKGDWKYGKLEIRAKMPVGKGMWPAIWMMPTDNVYGGWAASGEIDIMEYLGHEANKVHGTLHYGASWPNNKSSGKTYTLANGGFNDDFHTFTLIWEEGKIQWLVDGVLYQTQTSWNTTGHPFPAPFDQRFHMILNLAVGGNWPGDPDATTVFPQEFVVDYVRVYQKSTGVQENEGQKPVGFILAQNYPNPFNPTTEIVFQINKIGNVKLSVYNVLEQKVTTLVNESKDPGNYSVTWNGRNDAGFSVPSGIYFYQLEQGNVQLVKKMMLIK